MNKKVLYIILVFIFMFSITGCKAKDVSAKETQNTKISKEKEVEVESNELEIVLGTDNIKIKSYDIINDKKLLIVNLEVKNSKNKKELPQLYVFEANQNNEKLDHIYQIDNDTKKLLGERYKPIEKTIENIPNQKKLNFSLVYKLEDLYSDIVLSLDYQSDGTKEFEHILKMK